VWLGLCVVEVLPSPKFQLQPVTVPSESELASVKLHVRPEHDSVNEATGGTFVGLLPTAPPKPLAPKGVPHPVGPS
jgi:hypothetical protein